MGQRNPSHHPRANHPRRLGELLDEGSGQLGAGLVSVDLAFLDDPDQALIVQGVLPSGEARTHIYRQRDLARLRDLPVEEALRVFDHGRDNCCDTGPVRGFNNSGGTRNGTRNGTGDGTGDGTGEGSGDGNETGETGDGNEAGGGNEAGEAQGPDETADGSLQTALEAQVTGSAKLIEQAQRLFQPRAIPTCPKDWRPTTEVVHWRLIEPAERDVVLMVITHTCVNGAYGVVKTVMPIVDPALAEGIPARVQTCATKFTTEARREISLKHTTKLTKVGFGFSLGFNFSLPANRVESTPTKKDGVFEKGEPKLDPNTGKQIKFTADLMRLHTKLKFRAWQSYSTDVGLVCF